MKERITITLDKDLMDDIDNTIDGHNVKNRSHAMELLLNKALRKKSLKTAVLLAGGPEKIGLGKSKKSVSSHQVNGRPIIAQIMYSLKKYDINKFLVIGDKRSLSATKEFFQNSRLGAEINYFEENELRGTAAALKQVSEHITGPTLVCNTNALFQIDLEEMFKFHKNSNSLATIALTSVPNISKFGAVLLNGSKIFSFEEKPKRNIPTNLVSAGCYIMEPEILNYIPEGYSRFEVDVFPKLAKREELSGFVFYGKWIHIHDKESLERANNDW